MTVIDAIIVTSMIGVCSGIIVMFAGVGFDAWLLFRAGVGILVLSIVTLVVALLVAVWRAVG